MTIGTETESGANGEMSVDCLARFYGENRFAIAWTAGKEGENAKRVLTRGWPTTAPLVSAEDGVAEFAAREEHSNPAIVLRPSNLIGIDCDTAEGLEELQRLGLPKTLTARSSAEHKRHYYFRPPPKLETVPYVAFRFERDRVSADRERYLVCPPALHPSRAVYAFLPAHGAEIAELPADVYTRLVERATREAKEQRARLAAESGTKVREGQRRDTVFRYACMLRRWHGDDREAIQEHAFCWNERHCEPPLSHAQVSAQVDGAMKYEGGKDLQVPAAVGLEEVAGTAELLEAVSSLLREYVVLGEHERTALSLWVLHTHTFAVSSDELRSAAEVTPYIQVHSAAPGCGKTLLFEVLEAVVREPWKAGGITRSVLTRKMHARCPTLLLDEMDRMRAGDKELAAALEQVLNEGYRRRGVYSMSAPSKDGGWDFVDFRVFGPKAFAGIGKLTGALATRTIPIWLHPRLPHETIRDKFEAELWAETRELRESLRLWALANIGSLSVMRNIGLPDGLANRTREIWRPLLAIADMAGDEWPAKARAAAVALHSSHPDELHYRLVLLADVRAVFEALTTDRVFTANLIRELCKIEESPWRGWWWDAHRNEPKPDATAGLAKILRDYGIRSARFRIATENMRGYRREDFEDAWSRYLPSQSNGTLGTPGTTGSQTEPDVPSVPPVPEGWSFMEFLGLSRKRNPF
jgi:hypothetical protein